MKTYDFSYCEVLSASPAVCGAFAFGASEMNPAEALAVIDKIESAIQRIRSMDVGLKTAMVADLDRLREFAGRPSYAMIKPSGREYSKEETLAAAQQVMEMHKDVLTALANR